MKKTKTDNKTGQHKKRKYHPTNGKKNNAQILTSQRITLLPSKGGIGSKLNRAKKKLIIIV